MNNNGPKTGDRYYYLNSHGAVLSAIWCGWGVDRDRLAIGNVFRSRETARTARIRLEEIGREAILKALGVADESDD